jgi:thiol-disulfide isomerase/thioredoxin
LNGHLVSNDDPRFEGKVVIVSIMGSWCPNCHDEAPYLEALYRKYRGQGLEVVSLSFEEPEQLASLSRLRAFIQRYALTYTVLVGGTPAQAREKIPQAVDLDSWPTTFFIGRDGRVRSVHTGFAAPATGEFNVELRKSFEAEIEKLLAESARS